MTMTKHIGNKHIDMEYIYTNYNIKQVGFFKKNNEKVSSRLIPFALDFSVVDSLVCH